MTQTVGETVYNEFESERARGSTVQEAIAVLAYRHNRSEENIRAVSARRGAFKNDGQKLGAALKIAGAAAVVAFGFWFASPDRRPVRVLDHQNAQADYGALGEKSATATEPLADDEGERLAQRLERAADDLEHDTESDHTPASRPLTSQEKFDTYLLDKQERQKANDLAYCGGFRDGQLKAQCLLEQQKINGWQP